MSISELYLNPNSEKDFTGNETDIYLPLMSCEGDQHLQNLDPEEKRVFLSSGTKKCIDRSNAHISGGTIEGLTEHIVVISWQDCKKYRPNGPCASNEEIQEFYDHLVVTIDVG